MRALYLATTMGVAHSLAVAGKSKKPAIQSLMESATNMLKNGATPAVVDFAEETLNEVQSVVVPAIINESLNDQAFIYSLHSRFQVILDGLSADNQEVFQLNAEEQTLSSQHKSCRDVEKVKCDGKRECEMELYRLWTIWVTEEEELREIHGYISDHFCPPDANGTLHAFRVASVPWMQQYMAQKLVVDQAEVSYDDHRPDCIDRHSDLDAESARCNTKQTELEEKACAHATKINEVLATYYNDHAQATAQYNCAVEEIMQLEADRKREWVTLQVVNCLLERIREQNGAPCDDETGGVTEEVGVCEERHGIAVCVQGEGEPRLCLDYPPVPPHPPFCAARDQVVGECRPVVQPTPCCGEWHNQEYAALPLVPQPPFSETNPGCNAYPECVHCPDMETPQPQVVDSCPGYTADGCNDDEHDLTFVRSVDGTADVRCCDIDGSTCMSDGFEGGIVDPGGYGDQCIYDVTYQEALTICHNVGKRICTMEEKDVCCGTGCSHNHHAIWVNVAATTQQD